MPDPRYVPPVDGLLQGRVIAVTGASDGIGRAVAIAAAQHGAQVILIGRSARKLEAVRNTDLLARGGGRKIVALFPNTTPEAAMVPLNRIRTA